MEALYLAPRRLSNTDMLAAFLVSVLAHTTILLGALFLPALMPRQIKPVNVYAVNLVSAEDLKGPAVPPLKGSGGEPKSQPAKSGSAVGKPSDSQVKSSGPLVPVKRLQFDDEPQRSAPALKKLETADKPKVLSRVESSDSLEKDLDKLTKKPKSASKPPPPAEPPAQPEAKAVKQQDGGSGGSSSGSSSAKTSGQSGQGSTDKEGSTGGVPEGSPSGSAQAGAGGGQVGLARRLYYTEIWNAIRSRWALPDPSKYKGMEAILVLAIRRDGKILDIRFQKRSGNALFDESAEKAVRKADPLPPFPAIYSPSQEEIGVRFRPEDL